MRIYDRWILKLLAVFVVATCAVIQGQAAPRQLIQCLALPSRSHPATTRAQGFQVTNQVSLS